MAVSQSLRDALAQSQRQMVKPGLPFPERVLYKEAVQGLSHTLVDIHAQQGGTLVGAIDAILNGSGSGPGLPRSAPPDASPNRPRRPRQPRR